MQCIGVMTFHIWFRFTKFVMLFKKLSHRFEFFAVTRAVDCGIRANARVASVRVGKRSVPEIVNSLAPHRKCLSSIHEMEDAATAEKVSMINRKMMQTDMRTRYNF